MNNNTESKHAGDHNHARFPALITGSVATTLGAALMAVGLLAVPYAKAATKLSMADETFILAAAQGGPVPGFRGTGR